MMDLLSMRQNKNPVTVSQLCQVLTQIQDSHNKLNSLSDAREFYDPETASSPGATHVPSQPSTIIPSPRTMPDRDSGLLEKDKPLLSPTVRRFGLFSRIETWRWRKYKEAGE